MKFIYGGYSMKEYIKPQIELLEYSFNDMIAFSSDDSGQGGPEVRPPDIPGGEDDDGNIDDF